MRPTVAALSALLGLLPALATAEPKPLAVEASPVLPGALETVVELRNNLDVAQRGNVRLQAEQYRPLGSDGDDEVEAPFALAPKASGRLTLQRMNAREAQLRIDWDENSKSSVEPLEHSYNDRSPYGAAQLVDLDGNGALTQALSQTRTAHSTAHTQIRATTPLTLSSGQRVLPTTFAGYSGMALVLASSQLLQEFSSVELTALADWVLRGGTLAVSVSSAADLQREPLIRLLGGVAKRQPAQPLDFAPTLWAPQDSEDPAADAFPIAPATSELSLFEGGNLLPGPHGSVAAYGTGRVVLLPFDPRNAANNPWMLGQLADLTYEADTFAQARLTALSSGYWYQSQHVGDLDPNQKFRGPLGGAVILLLLYGAGVAWFLRRDQRQRQLFRVFAWLPAAALTTGAVIVGVGMAGRASKQQAARVFVVETAAGFGAASIDEHRGYFADGREWLLHQAQTTGSLLFSEDLQPLHQRDGVRFLVGRPRLPWTTTHTRELRVEQTTESVAVGVDAGAPLVVNRTNAPLRDLVLTLPDGATFYLAELAPGARAGREQWQEGGAHGVWNRPDDQPLLSYDLQRHLRERYAAIAQLRTDVQENPSVPSLLAIVDGAPPMASSLTSERAGTLPLRTVRSYLHVLGTGGEL